MTSNNQRRETMAILLSIVFSLASLAVSVWAIVVANNAANLTADSTARTEIVNYANTMLELDRAGDKQNTNQIVSLGESAAQTIKARGGLTLGLPASTFRIIGTYLDLDTDDTDTARYLARLALDAARTEASTVEEIRADRLLASIAAGQGDVSTMSTYFSEAFKLSSPSSEPRRGLALDDAKAYTGAYALYTSLWAAHVGGGTAACDAARGYQQLYKSDIDALASIASLDVSRQAFRVANTYEKCGLDPEAQLHLTVFRDKWTAQRAKSS